MPIYRLLQNMPMGPEDIRRLTTAFERNRHEHPRRQSLASAGVADRHPILTHGLDGRRDIAVGVAQELLGLAGLVCRSEQRTALIVLTVNQDGQEQSVIDVAGVEQDRK